MIFKDIMILWEIVTRFVEFSKMHPTDINKLKITINGTSTYTKARGRIIPTNSTRNVDWGGQPSSDGLTSSLEG